MTAGLPNRGARGGSEVMGQIKPGVRSNLIVAVAAGVAVAMAFVLLGDTGVGYAMVAAIIVAAVLYFIFETIV
jgi:hypothetical protein